MTLDQDYGASAREHFKRLGPEETPELNLNGTVLTIASLKVIAETLETYGHIKVTNCNTHGDQVITQWLDAVIERYQIRKTKGRNTDGC